MNPNNDYQQTNGKAHVKEQSALGFVLDAFNEKRRDSLVHPVQLRL